MIPVIHLFKKHVQIPKSSYTPDFRKSFFEWEDRLISRLGMIQNERLVLPADQKEKFIVSRTGMLIIQDILGYSDKGGKMTLEREARKMDFPQWYLNRQLNQYPEWFRFNKEDRVRPFELFSLETSKMGELELFLKYNELFIGEPARDDHKLCVLKKGEAVEIRINGKSDFTMTGRKERTYSEFDYIIEYLGDVETIDFAAENKLDIEREIPWKRAKMIDLRKPFY